MPGASRRRPRSTVEDDDDADHVRFGSADSPTLHDGAKRMRLRGGGSNSDSDDDDEVYHSFHDGDRRSSRAATTNGASDEGYQPGAIVRVCVENFVTYEKAEFIPGPNLNMVIGPNGTGKSSLVCAICLGLGYHSNVLGRASSFGEFVKHGKDSATVEIELQKRPKDKQNLKVKLRINREDNSRKFWVNGKECTHKNVQQEMRNLRIQIDNLCQFLPQDKVAEFAGLNSIDLLTKTLQAAAPEEMIQWQNELKRIYADQKEVQRRIETDAEQLQNMEGRQQGLQADVDRLREREDIQKNVQDLEHARCMVVYSEARSQHTQARERKKEAAAKLRQLQEDCGPSLEAVNSKQEYQKMLEGALRERKSVLKDAEESADRIVQEVGTLDDKLKELDAKRDVERANIQAKRKEVQNLRQKINGLEARLRGDQKPFNASEWNTKIREKEHLKREIETERREVKNQHEQLKILGNENRAERQRLQKNIEDLESIQGRQVSLLRKINPDVAEAWHWLQEHQAEFDCEVFGPPMITCSVRDNRYSNLIQSMLQGDDFLCFTAQSKKDHRKLSDQFYGTMKLSVTIRTCMSPLSSFRPPMSAPDASSLGLSGFAIEYIEGPEPVLAMLCAERRLHAAGVSLRDITSQQYDRLVTVDSIQMWAAGKQMYQVRRRKEYGADAVSTTTRNVSQGRFWTDQPIDTAEKDGLLRQIEELTQKFSELKDKSNAFKDQGAQLDAKERDIQKEVDELRNTKNQLQTEYNKWVTLPDKIEAEKKTLAARQDAMTEARSKTYDLNDRQDTLTLDRAKAVLRHKAQVDVIREAHQAVVEVQVRLIEAKSDIEGLKHKNADITRMLDEEQQRLSEIEQELTRLKKLATDALVVVKNIFEENSDRRQELEQIAEGKTIEDINNEIESEKSKLEFIHASNPNVLQEFERRGREIEKLRRQKGAQERDLDIMNTRIRDIREQWEPRLDDLVNRINDAFSYNFEQISCAGEVSVHKDEDFDKWAIEIKVKFRENEALQKLDQHRQSGGERAVSTIFYLMSLQSMAQAPFRVVDEINQGMDPRNERMVHERMVEIACREHTSQYFLITPKLLPGLRYDEKMRVLCIASGEHMPGEGKKLDFGRCVRIQRRLIAAA